MESQREARLDQLLAEFDRLGVSRQIGFEKLHLYSIITHSTAIEGSTITLDENTVMFDDGVVPTGRQVHEQLMNLDLKRAYEVAEELASARTDITLPLLKALSSLVMKNTGTLHRTPNGEYDESKGDLRLLNVSAGRGGRSYLHWEKVETRTKEYLEWLNRQLAHIDVMSPADVYDLSFEAHYRLVTIHPWSDGNGRVARLMMNLIQMEGEVIPSIVRSDHKARYIKALREAQEEGVSDGFLLFMADELLDDLQRTIDGYAASLARDVPWSGDCSDGVSSTPAPQATPQVTPQVKRFVATLGAQRLAARELRRRLGLSDAKSFRELYLRPAIDAGLAQMTIPERPRSKNQQYMLTPKGLDMLHMLESLH